MNASSVEPPLKRLSIGGAVGLAAGAALWLIAAFGFKLAVLTPYYASVFIVGGAAVAALGRMLFGGSAGMAAGLLVGFLFGASIGGESATARADVGEPAQIGGRTLDGKTLDMKDYRGKVVLIDFWATWCPPCVASMPRLKQLYDELHGEGLEIVAVSLDREREPLERFVRAKKIPWPQLYLREQDETLPNPSRKYDVKTIPRVMLVDREGNLASSDVNHDEIESAVRQLLAKGTMKPADAPAVPTTAWLLALMGALIGGLIHSGVGAGAGRS